MSSTSSPAGDPEYPTKYKNFTLSRSASGVLTLRFHTDGGPHTFDGTTHHDLPRLLEDIAFDSANRVLVLTGTGDSFIPSIDGPSLGDITKPMGFDVMYTEGRRGVQRLVDLEIPIIAAVNGPAPVHSEYALLANVGPSWPSGGQRWPDHGFPLFTLTDNTLAISGRQLSTPASSTCSSADSASMRPCDGISPRPRHTAQWSRPSGSTPATSA